MSYYPIFVEMQGRAVLLVGGGHVALEKIGKLVDAGARVTLIAPLLIEGVRTFVDRGDAEWRARPFQDGDTSGFDLVMVATDDGSVNAQIAAEARAGGAWVNAADDLRNCDFILPASVTRGTITMAASTAGTSPALARWLRRRMEAFLSPEVVSLGELLAEIRLEVRARDRACAAGCDRVRTPPPLLCRDCPNRIDPDRWQEAITEDVLDLLRRGKNVEARACLVSAIGLHEPLRPRTQR